MDDLLTLIGVGLVGIVSFFRFNVPPTTLLHSNDDEPLTNRVKRWFSFSSTRGPLFPPPRANTTLFKFVVYRATYTLIGIIVYLALIKIEGLSASIDAVIELFNTQMQDIPNLEKSGPFVLAVILSVILPKIPPISSADTFIRGLLYERAAIPAQQFRELQRLKEARFIPNQAMLDKVRINLPIEGFNIDDLHYDDTPTTCSLWTKTAVLMQHIEKLASEDRYQTAFAVLTEVGDSQRSIDKLGEMYKSLQGDAKIILKEQGDMSEREVQFRDAVKTLLYHIYNLLSRVSLHAHYSEAERVTQMHNIGFQLNRRSKSSSPDANDLVMLMLIVGAVIVVPLSISMKSAALAPLIGIIIYSAVLIPIIIASEFPALANQNSDSNTPNVAFPVLCGLLAALLSATLIYVYHYTNTGDASAAFARYYSRAPWGLIHAGIAILVAWRMRIPPTQAEQQAQAQHTRTWGSLTDAVIFIVACLSLVGLVIFMLNSLGSAPSNIWRPFLIIGIAAAAIGYFVPSWYRNNNFRRDERRGDNQDRQAYTAKMRRHLTSSYHT